MASDRVIAMKNAQAQEDMARGIEAVNKALAEMNEKLEHMTQVFGQSIADLNKSLDMRFSSQLATSKPAESATKKDK